MLCCDIWRSTSFTMRIFLQHYYCCYYSGFCHRQPATTTTSKIAAGVHSCRLYFSKKIFHNRSSSSSSTCATFFDHFTNVQPPTNAVVSTSSESTTTCSAKSKRCLFLFAFEYDKLFYHHRRHFHQRRKIDKSCYYSAASSANGYIPLCKNYDTNVNVHQNASKILLRKNSCWFNKTFKRSFLNWIPRYNTEILPSDPGRTKNNNNKTTTTADGEMDVIESSSEKPVFKPKKVVILTKLTRLEFERRTNPDLSEEELAVSLKHRGSDYKTLLEKYKTHVSYLNIIRQELENRGIEPRIVHRWDYSEENLDWADAVFTAGGDGTFLLAASKVRDRNKPLIGINTDPSGSEGYMCLLKKCPESKFSDALDKLLNGDFNWLWRQRIRVTLSGKNAFDDPIELHDQQLMFPEFRWSEHVRENEDVRLRSKSKLKAKSSIDTPDSPVLTSPLTDGTTSTNGPRRILPYLALNEVFIGESLSSRVSYYEIKMDDGEFMKQKSSGLTVCTGTGSTSWYFNINKLTERCVTDLIKIMSEEMEVNLPTEDYNTISRLCKRFNEQLIFCPSDLRMAYTVRDLVLNATFPPCPPRGFAQKVVIRSRCFDAHLVIDGGMSYIFNDGAQATLEMQPEDALRTVIFR